MISEKTLVSVIIPCYNQAKFLPDALESVLAQTHHNWECIMVDDGSTDNTRSVALEWTSKDERFRYFSKKNKGPSSARNLGLNIAKGSYIQFLDDDDFIHPEKFSLQIRALNNTKKYALSISDYFSSIATDLTQKHPSRYLTPKFKTSYYLQELITDWEKQLSIPVHCFLFKSALFFDHNITFNESLPNHEDWECWMNIFKLRPEVVYLDQKLATYRIRENAMCYDKDSMKEGYLKAIKIQKLSFSKDAIEYNLLNKKYNKIKYGHFTKYKVEAIFISLYTKIKTKLFNLLRKIKIS
jgi:glycosyltransferase involved in cell wall biosynthesis